MTHSLLNNKSFHQVSTYKSHFALLVCSTSFTHIFKAWWLSGYRALRWDTKGWRIESHPTRHLDLRLGTSIQQHPAAWLGCVRKAKSVCGTWPLKGQTQSRWVSRHPVMSSIKILVSTYNYKRLDQCWRNVTEHFLLSRGCGRSTPQSGCSCPKTQDWWEGIMKEG